MLLYLSYTITFLPTSCDIHLRCSTAPSVCIFFLDFFSYYQFGTSSVLLLFFFFFNDTATTEIYTLSLHDALPISRNPAGRTVADHSTYAASSAAGVRSLRQGATASTKESNSARTLSTTRPNGAERRSEEHTSELQSRSDLVCRLLLEKKKKNRQSVWGRWWDGPRSPSGAAAWYRPSPTTRRSRRAPQCRTKGTRATEPGTAPHPGSS